MHTELLFTNYILPILFVFMLAFGIHRISRRLVNRFFRLSELAPERMRPREQRRRTLLDLVASAVSVLSFAIAILFTIGLFVDTTTLVWMIGLFGAGMGLGARPLISDYMAGMSFIFEDIFDVGDKVEILDVIGVVEKINLRTLFIRAPSGDLYIVPNGEVRLIRNFSRGEFSSADIILRIYSHDLHRVLELLEAWKQEAVDALPDLVEPWMIVNESGAMGEKVELKLVVRAAFGRGGNLRPRLLSWIHKRLHAAEVKLVD